MDPLCTQAHAFADGELAADEAARFRDHLAGCARCQGEVRDVARLGALAAALRTARARAGGDVVALVPGAPGRPFRRRWLALAVPLSAAAAVALYVVVDRGARGPGGAPSGVGDPDLLRVAAASTSRAMAPRLSRPEAQRYLPYSPALGAGASPEAAPAPAKLHAALARLEEKSDTWGVATAYLLAGDERPAGPLLEKLAPSPGVSSDRAAVALQQRRPAEALALADEALVGDPQLAPARWNRGLALDDLGLSLAAAESFVGVAEVHEPGWSDEARGRADSLSRTTSARGSSWKEAVAAGAALADHGAPIPETLVTAHAGIVRLYLYHAIRQATSREQLLGLLPVATKLDGVFGGRLLAATVERAAPSDFSVRGPIAKRYAAFRAAPDQLDGAGRDRLLAEARAARLADIVVGVHLLADSTADHLEDFEQATGALGDPWFHMLAQQERARIEQSHGDYLGAEQRLIAAVASCHGSGVEYRCAYLEDQLAQLYLALHRPVEARQQAFTGWQHARAAGEWGLETLFLQDLVDVAWFERDYALARGYLRELELRKTGSCEVERFVRVESARMALETLHPDEARALLGGAPPCDQPFTLSAIEAIADLSAWGAQGDLETRASADLARLGERTSLPAGDRAAVLGIQGRLLRRQDPARATSLLRQAIAASEQLPTSNLAASKARAFSYSALVMAHAAAGRWHEAGEELAREQGAEVPARCLLGVAAEYDEVAWVARGADGGWLGRHEPHLGHAIPPAPPVGEAILGALRGCDTVDVLARPPLQGAADLLPPEVAWRYRVKREVGRREPSPGLSHRLVVAGVEPPPSLGLPRLGAWVGPAIEREQTELRGPMATPERVLAAMPAASVIELHAHGLVDLAVSDVSQLVLSPDPAGHYALTAAQVRRLDLRGAPLVILASCRAAAAAPYRHASWSLPMAFIEAGARAVLASPSTLQDLDAASLFARIRARLGEGATPAVALRDARVEWLRDHPLSSVRDVVLFE